MNTSHVDRAPRLRFQVDQMPTMTNGAASSQPDAIVHSDNRFVVSKNGDTSRHSFIVMSQGSRVACVLTASTPYSKVSLSRGTSSPFIGCVALTRLVHATHVP